MILRACWMHCRGFHELVIASAVHELSRGVAKHDAWRRTRTHGASCASGEPITAHRMRYNSPGRTMRNHRAMASSRRGTDVLRSRTFSCVSLSALAAGHLSCGARTALDDGLDPEQGMAVDGGPTGGADGSDGTAGCDAGTVLGDAAVDIGHAVPIGG